MHSDNFKFEWQFRLENKKWKQGDSNVVRMHKETYYGRFQTKDYIREVNYSKLQVKLIKIKNKWDLLKDLGWGYACVCVCVWDENYYVWLLN